MKLLQRWRQTSIHNQGLVLTGVLVAAGTIIYAAAAIVQIYIMNKNAKDSSAQVESLVGTTNEAIKAAVKASSESLNKSIDQNKDALGAALAQSKNSLEASIAQGKASMEASTAQSKTALDVSIEASRNDQRAWLSIGNLRVVKEPVIGEMFSVVYSISNSGKTPAMRATTKNQLSFAYGEPTAPDWNTINSISRSVIFPATLSRDISEDLPALQATTNVVNEYTNHRTKVYLRTRVDYSDVYGRPHWSEICSVHSFGDPADRWLNSCVVAGDVDTQQDSTRH